MNKELTPEIIAALKKPLPPEAVSPHPTKTYLSSIKAIYVVERLNEVFGLGKWFQKNEVIPTEGKMKIVHSFLTIPEYGIELDNFGGNDNTDEGDALKGAATDALTKMASYLYIGMDVYKGLADKHQPNTTTPVNNYQPKDKKPTEKQLKFIQDLAKQKGYTNTDLAEMQTKTYRTPNELITYLKGCPPKMKEELPVIQQETTEEEKIAESIPF